MDQPLWVGHLRVVARQELNNCSFQSYCYANNLQSVTRNVKDVIALLNASACFCRTCKMQLAPQKCWTWALTPKERIALAHCAIDGRRVPAADGAKGVGASITYNVKHKQTLTNNRIDIVSTAVTIIARLPTFAKAKLLFCRAVVLPRLLYGSEVALFNKGQRSHSHPSSEYTTAKS